MKEKSDGYWRIRNMMVDAENRLGGGEINERERKIERQKDRKIEKK